jgi:fucose 4-O-acetylase-like acetyltransferase
MPNTNYKFDEQRRLDWVDYSKGFGIFFVVVGHVLGGLQKSGVLIDSFWYRFTVEWLYAFHMPLFFFLSGLFVRRSTQRRSITDFIVDKMAVLIYPYFVWSTLQGLLQTSHYVNHPLHFINLFQMIYLPIDQFWFLYTLFTIMVIYRLFIAIYASDIAFFLVSVICFAMEISRVNIIQWDVAHAVGSFVVYFGAGVAIARGAILVRFADLTNGRLLAICFGGYATVAVGILIAHNIWSILSPVWAMAGIAATMALAVLMSRSTEFAFVKLWGVLSLEIYVAHVIAEALVRIALQKILAATEPFLHVVLGVGAGLYAPILLAYMCQRTGVSYVFTLRRARGQKFHWGTVDRPGFDLRLR